jgi:uncharacterized protein
MTASKKGTALVAGASSGIGAVYADRLAKRGYDLILVARNRDRLTRLGDRLATETGRLVEIIAADLADEEDVVRVETPLRTDPRITLLVNNAGVGVAASLLETEIEKMEAMIRLNVSALTRLTCAAVPSFVARGGGTIINVASIVAIWPERFNGVYSGTKAFVLAFSQSLQHELGQKGIRVQAVLPGPTSTEFWDSAGLPLHYLPSAIVMSPEDMVDAALAGLDQDEVVTIPGLPDKPEWDRFDAARRAMAERAERAVPAPRYNLVRTRPTTA